MRLLRLIIIFALFAPVLRAEDPVSQVEELIGRSFLAQGGRSGTLYIAEIHALENRLQEGGLSNDEQLTLKYMLSHWRMWTQQYLLGQLPGSDGRDFLTHTLSLESLGYHLHSSSLSRLDRAYRALSYDQRGEPILRARYAHLLATLADPVEAIPRIRDLDVPEALQLCGPASVPQISAINPSVRWRHDGWTRLPGMDEYKTTANGVRLRNIDLEPGDMVLVDLNQIFDGVNTSFGEPRSQFTHQGVVVFLERDGKRIPAMFEIHGGGLRLVPLHRYLSPAFITYGEVHRLKDKHKRPDNWWAELSRTVERLLATQMGYDFQVREIPEGGLELMLDRNQLAVVCSSLPDVIFKTLGVPVHVEPSALNPGVIPNLRRFGLGELADRGHYLTPTDFRRSEDFRRVGVIDNGFARNIVRELMMGSPHVPGSVGYLMTHRRLDPALITPWQRRCLFRSVHWAMDHLQRGTRVGKLIEGSLSLALGVEPHMLPQGPAEMLAMIVTLNNGIEKSGNVLLAGAPTGFPELGGGARGRCDVLFQALAVHRPFHLQRFETQIPIRLPVSDALRRSGASGAFGGP